MGDFKMNHKEIREITRGKKFNRGHTTYTWRAPNEGASQTVTLF